jgi:F-type H+-transporting ATPase subunit a
LAVLYLLLQSFSEPALTQLMTAIAKNSPKKFIAALCAAFILSFGATSSVAASSEGGAFNPEELIMHHIMDDHIWHFADGHYGTLYLPVIVYSKSRGLEVFSSKNFYNEAHELVPYNGYLLDHGHISLEGSEEYVLDLSITKNVAMLLLTAALLMFVFVKVGSAAKKNEGRAPKGIQNFFEPIVIFIRDEVAKPNIGKKHERYMPYLLTLFFFILFGNILGLLPGAANLTGNIAVTLVLAVFTFLVTNFSGNKDYWKHVFWTPGVPTPLKLIIVPVEIIGVFTKPISLMVRLFVAITAGHIVILSLISLIFVFGSLAVGFGSSLIVLFINLIEILVALIQAYVFTMFSSLYIGLATEEHDHGDHH